MPSQRARSTVLSMRSLKKSRSSGQCSQHVARTGSCRNVLGQVRVVVEVGEGHLGLDHPELGQVPARVRVLGAEGRAEGVDVAQRAGVGLALELAADGQAGAAAEEVLRVVDAGRRRRAAASSRSSVVTWNISPAPSQSLAVMIGVWT